MSCNRTRVRDLGRKKYPVSVRTLPRYEYISNKNVEIESIIVEVIDNDTKIIVFEKPFSSVPSVVANFISSGDQPNINIFVESTSKTATTVRMSAPVTGKVHIHAMYVAGQ